MVLLNLLIKPFWILGIEPKVQLEVGNALYGEYFVLFNFSLLLNILLDFGLTNFNNRNISRHSHLLEKHFNKMFTLKLVLGVFYFAVTMFLAAFFMKYDIRYLKLLVILCFNSFLLSFILYLRSNLLALHLFKIDSIISVLDRLIMILVMLILFLKILPMEVNIMNFVYAQTLGYGITTITALYFVLKHSGKLKLDWDMHFNLLIIKKSFPFAILVLLMTFYNRLDSVMIEKLLPGIEGKIQSGLYAKAFRLLDAANMIAYLFSVQLLPIFSKMIKEQQNVSQIVKTSVLLLITPAMIVSLSTYFYAEEFSALLYKGQTEGYRILAVLMLCFTAISATYIFGTLLTANGNLYYLNLMAFGGIVLNFILNLILIPRFEAMGAAISSLVTQFSTAAFQIWMSFKIFNFPVNKSLILSFMGFMTGSLICVLITKNLFEPWILNFTLFLCFSGVLAFATRLIHPKKVKKLMSFNFN
ncbi:MAG: polysaccharide biosynthesis C-terminal domain-containing protein [Bacteroidia bacterium]|nr:polysaccharide biosynthesis C-terminal domain-containing protein [Bacteroidia bacterium]